MKQHLRGDEQIQFNGASTGLLLKDFWAWNASDLLNNTIRGAYCEFIVSSALGLDIGGVNEDWGAYDIEVPFPWKQGDLARDTVRIEVKSSAYLQAWEQSRLSSVQFSIRPTRAWDPIHGYDSCVKRQSDVYVFCLYTVTDRPEADPLILDGWDFYVVPTARLDALCGPQKTLSLKKLLSLSPIKADYATLREAVIASLIN